MDLQSGLSAFFSLYNYTFWFNEMMGKEKKNWKNILHINAWMAEQYDNIINFTNIFRINYQIIFFYELAKYYL